MLRKGFVLAAFSAIGLWAAPASALTFCPNGVPGSAACVQFDVVDQAPGNATANATANTAVGADFRTFYQANLGTLQTGGGATTFTNGQTQFFTFVLGYQEHLNSNTAVGSGVTSLTFTYSANNDPTISTNPADPNYFFMYQVPALGDNLAGTGFVGTAPILSGHTVALGYSADFSTTGVAPPDTIECGAGTTVGCLDQGGADLGGGLRNNYPGVQTLNGTGSVLLKIIIDTVNPLFFPDLPVGAQIIFDTNTSTNIPYEQIDPSAVFSSSGINNGATVGGVSLVGPLNGAGGAPLCSGTGTTFPPGGTTPCAGTWTMFQADANSSFVVPTAAIPEPATLTLLGLGLLGSAAARRRQNKK